MRGSTMAVLGALSVALAGCASKPTLIALNPSPPPVPAPVIVVAEEPPPPISAINSHLSQAATIWHVRVALNVAALACRGPTVGTLVTRYNALLTTQKVALAEAETSLAAEFKANGGANWRDTYDDAMTKLYNYFSAAPARDAFCAQADQVLADIATVTPAALPAVATARLPTLDRPFTEVEIAAARGPLPPVALASTQIAPPRARPVPHLQVDAAALTTP